MADQMTLDGIPEPPSPPEQAALSFPEAQMASAINQIACTVHADNHKWWVNLETGAPIHRNVGEMLMLVVSEISEAMEGHRKNLPDDKLTSRTMLEVELADAMIRICDIGYGLGLDLGGAFVEKLAFNRTRLDHTREHRISDNGKKY